MGPSPSPSPGTVLQIYQAMCAQGRARMIPVQQQVKKRMGSTLMDTGPRVMLVCVCVCVYTHAVVSNSATPWTAAREAPLSMGFSRLEYWSELPFPPLWDLPGLGIKPGSLRLLHWQGILDHHATREVPYHAYRTRNDDFSRDVSAVLHFRQCLNGQII